MLVIIKMGMGGKVRDELKGIGAESTKYVRYTSEQVEVLERIYSECPKPSSSRRQQIIKDHPILSNIGQKQLKVWFQNRRYVKHYTLQETQNFIKNNSWMCDICKFSTHIYVTCVCIDRYVYMNEQVYYMHVYGYISI